MDAEGEDDIGGARIGQFQSQRPGGNLRPSLGHPWGAAFRSLLRPAAERPTSLQGDPAALPNSPRPVDFGAFTNRVAGKLPMNVNWYGKAPKHGAT